VWFATLSFLPRMVNCGGVILLVLGVDGGATKTSCVLADEKFGILGVGLAGSSNYHVVGVEEAQKSVALAIKRAIPPNLKKNIDVCCFGMGGLNTKRDKKVISGFIKPLVAARKHIFVNDVVIAFYAATCGEPGIVIVAGTGSIAYGVNKEGKEGVAGGWGWLIGDEGSAFYIAKKALMSASKAYDGRGKPTSLVELFCNHLKISKFENIISKIYEEMKPRDLASLAPLVTQAAQKGDEVAQKILEDAARELALTVKALSERLNMKGRFTVGAAGGVFKSQPVWRFFQSEVQKQVPGAELTKPLEYPVIGALIMGFRDQKVMVTPEVREKLEKSLKTRLEK
jgi:N-acetylglucosamine kinase-like BadF-type ATPase